MSLAGTLPGIGAWIRDSASTRFILKGEEINGYRLNNVKYLEVTLINGDQEHILFMSISTGNMTPPQKASVRPQPKKTPTKKSLNKRYIRG